MKVYKLTTLKHAEDISRTVIKTTEKYWKNKGEPVIYVSSSKDLATLEYYRHKALFNNVSDLMISCFEIPDHLLRTTLNKSILPIKTDDHMLYFFIQSAITNWRRNEDTVLIKLPVTIIDGKDVLLNPKHKDFQLIKMIYATQFVPAEKKNILVPQLEKPDRNTSRKYKRQLQYEIDIFMYVTEQKQKVVQALLKEINKFGCRYYMDDESRHYNESISKRVREGLMRARYVILIITEKLLERPTARLELQKVLQQQMHAGEARLIPVIAGIKKQKEYIYQQVPLLKAFPHYQWRNNAGDIIHPLLKNIH